MEYVKVFTDFAKAMEPLSDAERGRLFMAMLEYAASGTEPEFRGNERFLWPTAKSQIDRNTARYQHICEVNAENGSKGGRPYKTEQNRKNRMGFLKTEKSQEEEKDQEKEEDQDKEKEKEEINTPPNLPREVKENTKKEKVKEKGDVFGEFAGGNPELLEALRGFEQMRRGIKKPLTERAKQMVVDKLEKLSEPYRNRSGYQIACLNQSVLGCWQGVFELKEPFQDRPPEPVIEPETGEYRPPEWMGKENPTVEELFGVRFDP